MNPTSLFVLLFVPETVAALVVEIFNAVTVLLSVRFFAVGRAGVTAACEEDNCGDDTDEDYFPGTVIGLVCHDKTLLSIVIYPINEAIKYIMASNQSPTPLNTPRNWRNSSTVPIIGIHKM